MRASSGGYYRHRYLSTPDHVLTRNLFLEVCGWLVGGGAHCRSRRVPAEGNDRRSASRPAQCSRAAETTTLHRALRCGTESSEFRARRYVHRAVSDTLTLDTNIPLEYWKDQRRKDVVEQLLALARADEVSLMVTARIREDIPRDPLASEIDQLPELGITEGPSIARLDFWVLDRDMLGSDDFAEAEQEISEELSRTGHEPPDWRDWDHLHAHYLQDRDVFVTWDRGILGIRDVLRERFGLQIMQPEEYLASRSA